MGVILEEFISNRESVMSVTSMRQDKQSIFTVNEGMEKSQECLILEKQEGNMTRLLLKCLFPSRHSSRHFANLLSFPLFVDDGMFDI